MVRTYRHIATEDIVRTVEKAMSRVSESWRDLPARMEDSIESSPTMPSMRKIIRTIFQRWCVGWSDSLASALAAGLAWALAHQLLGHPQPVFAAVAAIVCLAPGMASRGGQAVNMMLGLVTGIVVGEILLLV